MPNPACFIGIDLGTSGCRAVAIDQQGAELASCRADIPPPETPGPGQVQQDPERWWTAVAGVLRDLSARLPDRQPARIAVDATSATLLLTTDDGTPVTTALMYNDSRSRDEAVRIARIADPNSAATGATSSLAKLLHLRSVTTDRRPLIAAHQADWITARLTGIAGISDWHNCLKLGYDPGRGSWPEWLTRLAPERIRLPEVLPPGTVIAPVSAWLAAATGLPRDLQVVAGTTDSTASAVATGARHPGDAVTCLGSTLVLKIVSQRRIDVPELGVYSHRYGNHWLVGGASNSGGAVLRKYFTDAEIRRLSSRLTPDESTGLDYYPLAAPGERFPIRDPEQRPRLTPRPAEDSVFLQGILEGVAQIEAYGYQRLNALGAPTISRITTIGGGASNPAWTRIRSRLLGHSIEIAAHQEAAYGSALIALRAGMMDGQASST